MIAWNAGHTIRSIDDEALLTPVASAEEIPLCIHGTYASCAEKIQQTGLKAMSRNHVHCAAGMPGEGGVISGMRGNCDVIQPLQPFLVERD